MSELSNIYYGCVILIPTQITQNSTEVSLTLALEGGAIPHTSAAVEARTLEARIFYNNRSPRLYIIFSQLTLDNRLISRKLENSKALL